MRKIVLSMFTSLDGYINGPDGRLKPPAYGPDLQKKWIERNIERADLMMYGRTCYEGMVSFWTSPAAPAEEKARLEAKPKLVFSTTLQRADWANTRIIRSDIASEMERAKAQPGKDIVLLGGAGIATSFLKLGLIDELNLLVSPALFGGGTRLFEAGIPKASLKLLASEPLDTGAVLITYAVEKP